MATASYRTAYVAESGLETHEVPTHSQKSFQGVGGLTTCKTQAVMIVDELREETRFWVNGSSPALMSVGKRCMERGMSFVWPAGSNPYYVAPWGEVIPLVVDG